jgi:hypothetical protein
MPKIMIATAFAATFGLISMTEANAFSRTVTGTGGNGGSYTHQGTGDCTRGGGCSWSGSTVGPNGKTASHSGTAVNNGNGTVGVTGSGTGFYGRAYNRSTTYYR